MKLVEGKQYTIILPAYTYNNLFYTGKCDCLCGQACDICGKELEKGHLFMKPFNNKMNYSDCVNGGFTDQIAIGYTCIRKIKIIPL